jgi:L-threonylcarbamoyladenylate synthase
MTIDQTIEVLKQGGTILYPTDTIWGLGCDATNNDSCKVLINLKNRPEEKSFIVLVDGFPMLERYVPDFHPICYDLVDFAEKPLTIIYPSAKGLAPSILANDGTIGIRITKDPNCLKLIRALKKPLVSTSANLSGSPSPTCFDEIDPILKSNVDAILEDRTKEKMTKPSQIIKIGIDGSVKIIRA